MSNEQGTSCSETDIANRQEEVGSMQENSEDIELNGSDAGQVKQQKMDDDRPWIDKGWAWVTVTAGFAVLFLAIGQMRCVGIYFAELQDVFPGSSTLASIMPSIIYIMTPFICLPSSVLTSCYGTRPVVIAAILLIAFAQASTLFATDIIHILIFYSIPFGIGSGLGYTSAIILVSKYFVKHRSFAQGIMLAGFALTGIAIPPIYSAIKEAYEYRGAMMLIGGILLHAIIPACLLRPPEFWEKIQRKIKLQRQNVSSQEVLDDQVKSFTETKVDIVLDDKQENIELSECTDIGGEGTELSGKLLEQYTMAPTGSMVILGNLVTASREDLDEIQQNSDNQSDQSVGCFRDSCSKLRRSIHWSLLKNYAFLSYMVVALCGFIGFQMTFTILPSHARDLGFTVPQSYFLISAASFGELPARVIIPFLADRWSTYRHGRRFHVMSISLTISGVCVFLIAYASRYVELVVCSICIGVFSGGGFLALNVDVLRDAIGLEKLANGGLGLNLFLNGITMSAMTMLLGHLRDQLESYEIPFIAIGCITIFGGLFTWMQPLAQRLEDKKTK